MWAVKVKNDNNKNERPNMKNDKIISGNVVRKNSQHPGMWNIMETRAGQLTGKASFTGTMKEVREAIKLGNQIAKAKGVK